MYDCAKLISKFHELHIRLTTNQQSDMRKRRETNLDRLKNGLLALKKPAYVETINQGGYAMKSMVQPPEKDNETRYDIDTGIVFEDEDALTPRTTRNWVRDAIKEKAQNLKYDPETKKKCVRVTYTEGYQVDFPVLKRVVKSDGEYDYELSSGDDWAPSNPKAINEWFERELKKRNPETSNYQCRRIVRLLKYYGKVHAYHSRASFPASLLLTVLAVECYSAKKGRDDEAFYLTIKAIKNRLNSNKKIDNPVDGTELTDEKDADRIDRFVNALGESIDALDPLETDEENQTTKSARKAWKAVFKHSFFDTDDAENCFRDDGGGKKYGLFSESNPDPVKRDPGDRRYG